MSSSKALQAFPFSLPHPGPNPVRQAIPHPHQVALDPSGQFILNPDLGADVVRVFAINQTSGILTQCPSLNATAGSGPRHVAFQVPSTATGGLRRRNVPPSQCLESTAVNGTIMYLASELANNLTAFNVDYTTNGCLAFTKKQTGYTFAGTPPPGSAVAEVRVLVSLSFTASFSTKKSSSHYGTPSNLLAESNFISHEPQHIRQSHGQRSIFQLITKRRLFQISQHDPFVWELATDLEC